MFNSTQGLRASWLAGFASAGLAIPAAAIAQQAPIATSTTSDDAEADRSGDETVIVVTAERRRQDLLETSLAATVLSGDDLDARQVNNLDALQFAVPSLTVNNFGQGNVLNIRGVGRTEVVTQAAAGVPIYRDGVATFNAYFASGEPYFDIANIQVLRGPQGTFAGQNSTGGAIFVTTNDPDTRHLSGEFQLQAGNYDQIAGRAMLNVPLGETVALRFAADAERRDSFYDYRGPFTGTPERMRRFAGRVGLLVEPGPAFRAVFKVDYDYADNGANTYAPIASPDDLFDVGSNTDLFAKDRFVRATANLAYTFGSGHELRSISAYQWGKTRQKSDSDGTEYADVTLEYLARESIVSQEINLVSPSDRSLNYVLGAYYSTSLVDLPKFEIVVPPTIILLSSELRRVNKALFGNLTYAITPQLTVELGARYNHATIRQDLETSITFSGFPLGVTPGPDRIPSADKVTGKAGLSYQIGDDHNLFATVSSGYKNPGLNTSVLLPPSFEGETLVAYQAGYKARLLDRRVTMQLDYYHYRYRNYQLNQFDPATRQTIIANVPGTSRANGVEFQLNGLFGPAAFNFAAAYATSDLPSFFSVDPRFPPPAIPPSAACVPAGPATSPQCLDLTGGRLPYQPKWTASAGVQYRFALGTGSLTPRLDIGYIGTQYTTVFRHPVLDRLDSRTLLNAQLSYENGPWGLTAFSTNLTDKAYIVAKLSGLRVAGNPRQYGLRLRYGF